MLTCNIYSKIVLGNGQQLIKKKIVLLNDTNVEDFSYNIRNNYLIGTASICFSEVGPKIPVLNPGASILSTGLIILFFLLSDSFHPHPPLLYLHFVFLENFNVLLFKMSYNHRVDKEAIHEGVSYCFFFRQMNCVTVTLDQHYEPPYENLSSR